MGITAQAEFMPFEGIYRGKRVLVTGHTGFKGSWLCEWLLSLNADVTGYALQPDSRPSLFEQLRLASRLRHLVGDIRSADHVRHVVNEVQPDFVFHLAAQPLVRQSYREPTYTWATNVIGTVNLLEALRLLDKHCAAVMVTTDKCYDNREWVHGYRETDALGGHDPYSSSKAAAELAIASWRKSFFGYDHPVRIATARAGNVIGGGDWAQDRIIPDTIRALARGESIHVRNPHATRPWQHVLEPNSAYLAIAAALSSAPMDNRLQSAFNIGPGPEANQTVQRLVETALSLWPGSWIDGSDASAFHEASLLQLDNSKIRAIVGWRPAWAFSQAVERTVTWYREMCQTPGRRAVERTVEDIKIYERAALQQGIAWASHGLNNTLGKQDV
jgi:CDP-glucose 4,6-dehydratase